MPRKTTDDTPPMVTAPEAARIKGVSRQAVYAAIETGKLPAVQSGKTWLIRRRDLDRWEIVRHRPKKADEGRKGATCVPAYVV